ncbi:unnamed protein product [Tuber aestivum]|uniref:Uncharacterized protein n=1 Tax=Tuber aestivum TaxID=59557 RepID=A0A292PTQ2_9PEZI|nr:unnamed protein product [Tuber aestivum]
MNALEVYQPPESPPQSPPLVAYGDPRPNTASTVIATLSLCAVFLALAFLAGYGVYRFGTGFLLGKRVPRERGEATGDNGGINTGARGGGAHGDEGIGGGLDTVVEVPEEEEKGEEKEEAEEKRRGDMRESGAGRKFADIESGRWW